MSVSHKKTWPLFFGLLTIVSFCAIFILAALGNFTIWVSIGATVYFAFMTVWSLLPAPRKQFTRKRFDPKEEERREYIRFHTRLLINIFLAAILLVVVILWFAL
jgi:hypothetical protein